MVSLEYSFVIFGYIAKYKTEVVWVELATEDYSLVMVIMMMVVVVGGSRVQTN